MADGFKIAEAYVEIHARMNSRAVQREIQKGLDEAGLDAAGRNAGEKISAGIREKVGAGAKAAGDSIKKEIGDAGDSAKKDFDKHGEGFIHAAKAMGNSVGKVFADMFNIRSPMLALAAIALAIAAIPLAATAASIIVVGAFGAAFSAIGLSAALFQEKVQIRFRQLWIDLKEGVNQISGPFTDVWVDVADEIQKTFNFLAPALQVSFKNIQPHIDKFVSGIGKSFRNLEPMITPVTNAFGVLLDKLGDRLPTLFSQIAKTATEISHALEDNPESIDLFVDVLENLISVIGKVIAEGTKLAAWFKTNEDFVGGVIWSVKQLVTPLQNIQTEMGKVRDVNGNVVDTNAILDESFAKLREETRKLQDQVVGLVRNLDELAKANLSNEQAAVKFDKSIINLDEKLKANGVTLDSTTKEGNENKTALLDMAQAANDAKTAYVDAKT